MLFADGESRPEVYSAATVKDQAKICFSDAVEIVKATALKTTSRHTATRSSMNSKAVR